MPRALVVTALLALGLLAAACGGGGDSETDAPRLPARLAENLAERSEGIAQTLDAGDVCAAAQQADELRAAVIAAVNEGRVPAPFQEELLGSANELVNEVNCPPPDPAPEPEEPEPDCEALAAERDALQEQRDEAESEEEQEALEQQLQRLEEQLQECPDEDGDDGNGEGGDD